MNRQLGVEDLIEEWLDQTLADKNSILSIDGLRIMTDNADILKQADDYWRAGNPVLAAQQPLE
ncbi:hypothetical protein [Rhizobium leguminosarum]|uniref:hypothetical protein n=1 Tax=Rhizobium leguminosarum TaxID=384 RepID=UPI003F9C52A4